jgi:hypothetical protein
MKRWKLPIALYLFVVFVSGAVVGALGYRTYKPPTASSNARVSPAEWRRQYLQEIETRANLTPEQVSKVDAILEETYTRFHEARDKHNSVVKQIGEQQRDHIRALLNPDQLPKAEQFWQDRDQRNKQNQH